jgi:phosphotransacetylase
MNKLCQKQLLIIGDGDIHINLADVAGFGICGVENLTPAEFAAREDFTDCVIMKGLIETSDFMRKVLAINKSLGGGFISHCGVFKRDDIAPFIITDAALNIAPSLEDKKHITKNAIELAQRIKLGVASPPASGGSAPKRGEGGKQASLAVNFLTPSSKTDKKIKSSMDAAELEKYVAENFIGVRTTHNALDVCFSDSAKAKKIEGALRPDILVCDNIDQGNSLYKALTIFGGFMTAGFIVGNRALPPVILTSRSDTRESKLWSVALSCPPC